MTRRDWMIASGLGLTSKAWPADHWKKKRGEWSEKKASEKEVTFVTAMGPLKIRARFVPKEMLFAGKLEI